MIEECERLRSIYTSSAKACAGSREECPYTSSSFRSTAPDLGHAGIGHEGGQRATQSDCIVHFFKTMSDTMQVSTIQDDLASQFMGYRRPSGVAMMPNHA